MDSTDVKRKVWITSSEYLSRVGDLLPSNIGRQSLVTNLVKAYGLEDLCDGTVAVSRIHRRHLETYHEPGFVNCLLRKRPLLDSTEKVLELKSSEPKDWRAQISEAEDEEFEDVEKDEKYGLSYDCYPFPLMADYVNLTASSSITSANKLIREKSDEHQHVAINWFGGRHHCGKRKAAGFCYVNDIVLSISALRKSYRRVFYLDLDLHHGDGVENAYEFSKNVATCSVHRCDVGFYPGTGSLDSSRKNKYNIPTHKGLSDKSMNYIIQQIVWPLISRFDPGVVVVQMGCDGLATDPHKEWNLTIKGYGSFIRQILQFLRNTPVLLLGGGGYNHTETAKCWAYVTKVVLQDQTEWDLLPEHPQLDSYEDDGFQFWTDNNRVAKNMKDENTLEELERIKERVLTIE